MIQKNEFPILEYDFDSTEILKPNHGAEQLTLPEKCVFAFLGDTIDSYAAETGAAVAEHFETITKTYPIYVVKNDGEEFCLCQAPLGAPAAAQFMDCLIACGCRKIVTAGSCGVLTEMAENEFLIPTKALRDEGTSYHYLPAARYAEPASEAVQAIEKTFRALGLPFQWNVLPLRPAPKSAEQLLDKFCTQRIPLQMQSSMMTVTGERIRCGKRWNSA